MANTPTYQSTRRPGQLNAFEFGLFAERMKDHKGSLTKYGIPYNAFLVVCLYVSRHCTFRNGEDIRTTVLGLADATGTGRNTVRLILDFLKAYQVLVVVDEQGHATGKDSEVYRLNRSDLIRNVLGLDGVILTYSERKGVADEDDAARAEREHIHAVAANRAPVLDKLTRDVTQAAQRRIDAKKVSIEAKKASVEAAKKAK